MGRRRIENRGARGAPAALRVADDGGLSGSSAAGRACRRAGGALKGEAHVMRWPLSWSQRTADSDVPRRQGVRAREPRYVGGHGPYRWRWLFCGRY